MNFKFFTIFSFLAIAAASFTAAFELFSTNNLVLLQSAEGKTFFYADNLPSDASTKVYFSANLGQLSGHFDSSVLEANGRKTIGTYLHYQAADSLRGEQKVTVTAQVCTNSSCESKQKSIIVSVAPSKNLSAYNDQMYVNYDSKSRIEYDEFVATRYTAKLSMQKLAKVISGNVGKVKVLIENTEGPKGTFQLNSFATDPEFASIFLDAETVTLEKNEVREVTAFIKTKKGSTGTFYATIQVLNNDRILQENHVTIQVLERVEADFYLPEKIELDNCRQSLVKTVLFNDGTSDEVFKLSSTLNPQVTVKEPKLSVSSNGGTREVAILIDTTSLPVGTSNVTLTAESLIHPGFKIEKILSIYNSKCDEKVELNKQIEKNNKDFKITLEIRNDFATNLENVSVSLTELPENWTVKVPEDSISITPNETAKISITATAPDNFQGNATGLILVYSKGKVLESTKVRFTEDGNVLTGFATAALQTVSANGLLLATILVLLIVAYYASSLLQPKQSIEAENSHEKLAKLKNLQNTVIMENKNVNFEQKEEKTQSQAKAKVEPKAEVKSEKKDAKIEAKNDSRQEKKEGKKPVEGEKPKEANDKKEPKPLSDEEELEKLLKDSMPMIGMRRPPMGRI